MAWLVLIQLTLSFRNHSPRYRLACSSRFPAVTLSVLAPVRDVGPSFREHVRACLRAVSELDVEIVVLDNQSIDGCCHGLPREVLIVRTERLEPPAAALAARAAHWRRVKACSGSPGSCRTRRTVSARSSSPPWISWPKKRICTRAIDRDGLPFDCGAAGPHS